MQPAEHRRHRPAPLAQEHPPPRRQHARHVALQPLARDVRQATHHAPLDRVVAQEVLQRPHVDARRLQQLLADRAAQLGDEVTHLQAGPAEDDLAH